MGFIFKIKKPKSKAKAARLVVTPTAKGKANVTAKFERDFGRKKCVKTAYELLACSGAPQSLLDQVKALLPGWNGPFIA